MENHKERKEHQVSLILSFAVSGFFAVDRC
jgi:hypothetical protein